MQLIVLLSNNSKRSSQARVLADRGIHFLIVHPQETDSPPVDCSAVQRYLYRARLVCCSLKAYVSICYMNAIGEDERSIGQVVEEICSGSTLCHVLGLYCCTAVIHMPVCATDSKI
jgi:hypothetical protein